MESHYGGFVSPHLNFPLVLDVPYYKRLGNLQNAKNKIYKCPGPLYFKSVSSFIMIKLIDLEAVYS
jgi:hypothetical protein